MQEKLPMSCVKTHGFFILRIISGNKLNEYEELWKEIYEKSQENGWFTK